MYDSGVGGLTVLAAFVRQMPQHDYIYFGDTLHAPYGDRSPEEIRKFSLEAVRQLLRYGIDGLVVACNTSASVASETLRDHFPSLPIFTLADASGAAVQASGAKKIGLLATQRTVEAGVFEARIRAACPSAEVVAVAAPALVPLIERGLRERDVYEPVLQRYLSPLAAWGADVLILGCTHYPLIREHIQRWLPDTVLIDPAEWLAQDVCTRMGTSSRTRGSVLLLASGNDAVMRDFWKMVAPPGADPAPEVAALPPVGGTGIHP